MLPQVHHQCAFDLKLEWTDTAAERSFLCVVHAMVEQVLNPITFCSAILEVTLIWRTDEMCSHVLIVFPIPLALKAAEATGEGLALFMYSSDVHRQLLDTHAPK